MNVEKKIKNQAGFTLAETLLTVLILLMVTAIVASGIPTAKRAYERVILGANSQMLLSTAVTELRSELCTAQRIEIADDGTSISYYDSDLGVHFTIERAHYDNEAKMENGMWIHQKERSADGRRLVSRASSTAASNGDLYVTFETVTKSGQVITFTNLTVMHNLQTMETIPAISIRVLPD